MTTSRFTPVHASARSQRANAKAPTYESADVCDLSDLLLEECEGENSQEDNLAIVDNSNLSPADRRKLAKADEHDLAGMYFEDIHGIKLLEWEEEVSLGKRIERSQNALRELNHEIASPKRRARLGEWVRDGKDASETLFLANVRLVISLASKCKTEVPVEDLIQEGNLGLMRAIEKYDWRKGFRFSTYAHWWIRQAITRAVADMRRTVRIPAHTADQIREVMKFREDFEARTGGQPREEDIANGLKMTLVRTREVLMVMEQGIDSLDRIVSDDESETTLGDLIEDSAPTVVEQVAAFTLVEKLHALLSKLENQTEAMVLKLRFGIVDGIVYTPEEISQQLDIPREEVRRMEHRALYWMRRPMNRASLQDYSG